MDEYWKLQDAVITIHDVARDIDDEAIALKLRLIADQLTEVAKEVKQRDLAERRMRFPHKEDQVGSTPTVTTRIAP